MDKIFGVIKPVGPTSHDVIDQIRKITGERRVGHAGTLDPEAGGVLVVAIGREATKKLNEHVKKEKEYDTNIRLGQESTTDDEEGEKRTVTETPVSKKEITSILEKFKGKIIQVPPAFSAIKLQGTPAYRLARRGIAVELKPRLVEIKEIELFSYDWPNLRLRVVCGPGVYIRALARDIGKLLGCGAYLTSLTRTRVGDFLMSNSFSLRDFGQMWKKENVNEL